ncbi:ribosome small subunit-dependent GTPase A [Lysinibacillus sp. NPDC094177]|uniref:ribosome small subunit-dependent GTPase A n=1 Tax=Lysinibacillus sp. NPDC094177 TaxID=3390580 RepID=UPI003D05EBEA
MIDLKQFGYNETETPPIGLIPGRVTEQQREQYTIITEQGEVTAVLKGAFYYTAGTREDFPCVGDFVFLQYNERGTSCIAKLLPRRSKFSRADYSGHAAGYVKTILEQVVATNFDYVFIVSSLNWDFKVSRIMRYLTQARQSGGKPVVILTKADLAPDFSEPLAEVKKIAPDVPVHAVSSHTGIGLDGLSEYLQPGKTVVFLGMSGVGKSSLLNALINKEVMTVKAIREVDSRGRHTTTHRQLFMLPSGAMVIDTPGMRELGLFGADDGVSAGFNEVEELFTQCRFNDCRHQTEPGCAVLAALADRSLAPEHWERYLVQKRENKFVDDKSRYLMDKRARQKSIAMRHKGNKGGYKK